MSPFHHGGDSVSVRLARFAGLAAEGDSEDHAKDQKRDHHAKDPREAVLVCRDAREAHEGQDDQHKRHVDGKGAQCEGHDQGKPGQRPFSPAEQHTEPQGQDGRVCRDRARDEVGELRPQDSLA